jgi:WD40 repeat protein
VTACAFSPDGGLAVSGSADRTVRVWSIAQAMTVAIFAGHTDRVIACAFGRDGRTILSASRDGTLRLWDVASQRTIRTFEAGSEAEPAPIERCAFAPDGRSALSASGEDRVDLWDLTTGEVRTTYTAPFAAAVAFRSDGRRALRATFVRDAAQDRPDDVQPLRLWSVPGGKRLHLLEDSSVGISECAFSPNGRYALGVQHTKLHVWDVTTGQLVYTCAGQRDRQADRSFSWMVWGYAFSPDSRYVANPVERAVHVSDVASRAVVRTLTGHTADVNACAFSPDGGSILSGSSDGTLRLWDLAREEAGKQERDSAEVIGIQVSAAGDRALTMSSDNRLSVWDVSRAEVLQTFAVDDAWGETWALSPDGRSVLGRGADHRARLWDVASGAVVRAFESDVYRCYGFSPDGRYVLLSSGRELRLWSVRSGKPARGLDGSESADTINACAFSPDGRYVVSAESLLTTLDPAVCILRLWDVASGRLLRVFEGHLDGVRTCAFSPDGRYVLSSSGHSFFNAGDPTARLWDIQTEEAVHVFEDDTYDDRGERSPCRFSPDGRYVVTAVGSSMVLWDVASGARVRSFVGHARQVRTCCFTPDGRYLLTGGDASLRMWDVASGESVLVWRTDSDPVTFCAVSGDGLHVIAGGRKLHFLTLEQVRLGHPVAPPRMVPVHITGPSKRAQERRPRARRRFWQRKR